MGREGGAHRLILARGALGRVPLALLAKECQSLNAINPVLFATEEDE